MINTCLLFLVLGPSLYLIAEGCGRVPATPAPTTPLTPTEPTINGSVRNVECTSGEVNRTACLNEGTCFAMVLNNGERIAACHCPEYYKGKRCQEFYIPILPGPSQDDPVSRAGIAASIAVLIIIVVVFIVVAILYYRRKKAAERIDKNANGTALLPNGERSESHIPPRNMQLSVHVPVYSTNGNGICRMNEENELLFSEYKNELLFKEYKVTPV